MKGSRLGRKLTVRTNTTQQSIPDEERELAERVLARLVARAFTADHRDLFHVSDHSRGTR